MSQGHSAGAIAALVRELATALAAEARQDANAVDRFKAAFVRTGRELPPVEVNPTELATVYRALGFGESYRAYVGKKPRRTLNFDLMNGMPDALRALGICRALPDPEPTADSWISFLKQAIAEARKPRSSRNLEAHDPEMSDPDWREVRRDDLVSQICAQLNEAGVATIMGMSGAGKTALGKQVMQQIASEGGATLQFDAREWLVPAPSKNTEPNYNNYLGLCDTLLRTLAQSHSISSLSGAREEAFTRTIALFRAKWDSQVDAGDQAEFLTELRQDQSWETFVLAVRTKGLTRSSLEFVGDVAGVLSYGLRAASVFIDDVWGFDSLRPVVAALLGLSNRSSERSRLRILLASQEELILPFAGAGTAIRLGGRSQLDTREHEFCYDIVAAWAIEGEHRLSRATAIRAFDSFKSRELIARSTVCQALDLVIDRVGAHPLALAALASAWRSENKGYRASFWKEVAQVLKERPRAVLSFDPAAPHGSIMPNRFDDVLVSLRYAWSLLETAAKERYLDLVLAFRRGQIHEEMFHLFWERIDRGRERLPAVMARHQRPLSLFLRKSLVSEYSDEFQCFTYSLSDLHRAVIEEELRNRGPEAIAERHREWLRTFGLIDENNLIRFDDQDEAAYWDDGGQAYSGGHVATARWPRFGDQFDADEVKVVRLYFQIAFQDHVEAAQIGPPESDPEERMRWISRFSLASAALARPVAS